MTKTITDAGIGRAIKMNIDVRASKDVQEVWRETPGS